MWKIWLAVGIAVLAAIITVGAGIVHQMRFAVILQRTIISILVAGCCGYALSLVMDRVGLPYLFSEKSEEQTNPLVEETEAADEEVGETAISETEEKTEFAPFTADNLNRVSPPDA